MYSFPKSTVHDVIKKFEEHGLTKVLPKSGRPLLLDDRDKRHLIQFVNKDHYASLSDITTQMQDLTLNDIFTSTPYIWKGATDMLA